MEGTVHSIGDGFEGIDLRRDTKVDHLEVMAAQKDYNPHSRNGHVHVGVLNGGSSVLVKTAHGRLCGRYLPLDLHVAPNRSRSR